MTKYSFRFVVSIAFVVAIIVAFAMDHPARADVVLPCPPRVEQPCDDCVRPPGMPKPEHPLYQSPCWANGDDEPPANGGVPTSIEPPPPSTQNDYEGTYQLSPDADLKIFVRDGKLYAESRYQPAIQLTRVSNDRFVAEAVAAYFDFERDTQGTVVAVVFDQAEKVIHACRYMSSGHGRGRISPACANYDRAL